MDNTEIGTDPTPDVSPKAILEIEAELSQDDVSLTKTGADVEETRKKEAELFKSFQKNPSKETFGPLYQSFKPLIFKAAQTNTYRSSIPKAAHTALAAQSFFKALQDYKPEKGASLRTYVFNAVREKGKRLNLKYQNIGYIPEARATKYSLFQSSVSMLRSNLGREPSTLEIADELKWSPKMVETMRKEMRGSLLLNEEMAEAHAIPTFQTDKAKQVFMDMQYDLIPQHQLVLEHTVGLNGKEPLQKPSGGHDTAALIKATGLNYGQVTSALKTIKRKYEEYTGHGKGLYDNLSVGIEPGVAAEELDAGSS